LARWHSPDGEPIEVVVRQHLVEETGDLILAFRVATVTSASNFQPQMTDSVADVLHRLSLRDEAASFLDQLQIYHSEIGKTDIRISLLLLDVFFSRGQTTEAMPEPESAASSEEIDYQVNMMYRRENHVVRLRGNCFGFLIRHDEESKAYLMTRKLMQMFNQLPLGPEGVRVRSTGSLLSVSNHPEQSCEALLVTASKGLQVARRRGLDQALLIDLKRVLAAYPGETESSPL